MPRFAKHVLLVDDDPEFLSDAAAALIKAGCSVTLASNPEDAFEKFCRSLQTEQSVRLVIADIAMPDVRAQAGIRLAEKIKRHLTPHYVYVLVVTSNVTNAVSEAAWQARADGFIVKSASVLRPEWWQERLEHIELALREKEYAARARAAEQGILDKLIGYSPVMQKVKAQIREVAPTMLAVLIQGETGTGKELVADAIQRLSPRCDRPYLTRSCAELNESTLASELFGHVEGAFTGANAGKTGIFEAATPGTLFLDEINSASPELQGKLLRVLEKGVVFPVGSNLERRVDVRILAASNVELKNEVQAGRFREDLYFRIGGDEPIKVPPLRERLEDIPLLCEAFAGDAERVHGVRYRPFDESAIDLLRQLPWDGNVRELRNRVARLLIRIPDGGDPITAEAMRQYGVFDASSSPGALLDSDSVELAKRLAALNSLPKINDLNERAQQIAAARALRGCSDIIAAAARLLADNDATFRSRLRTWEKKNPEWRSEAEAFI